MIFLKLKPIDLSNTPEDESTLDEATGMTTNQDGDARTDDQTTTDSGNKSDINNLNPDKNKRR